MYSPIYFAKAFLIATPFSSCSIVVCSGCVLISLLVVVFDVHNSNVTSFWWLQKLCSKQQASITSTTLFIWSSKPFPSFLKRAFNFPKAFSSTLRHFDKALLNFFFSLLLIWYERKRFHQNIWESKSWIAYQ